MISIVVCRKQFTKRFNSVSVPFMFQRSYIRCWGIVDLSLNVLATRFIDCSLVLPKLERQ